jgi:small subunit ribosomal protein S16
VGLFVAPEPMNSLQLAAGHCKVDFQMVTIRLTRRGGKKTPFYHVVVTDSRKRQGGTSLESVGLFNPVARGAEVKLRLDVARIEHWLKEGAHMSERVKHLLTVYRKQAA